MQDLSDLIDGPLPDGIIESLEVTGWRSVWWKSIHSIAVAHLCNRFRVKRLFFSEGFVRTGFYTDLAKHATTSEFPFLPHLRTFEMDFSENTSCLIQRFVDKSKVTRVLCSMEDELDRDELLESCDFFLRSFSDDNLNLRKIEFYYPWDSRFSVFEVKSGGVLQLTPRLSKVLIMLERNSKAFKKCQQAIISLLRLRKLREFGLYRDVLGLVSAMVWSTRGTKVWIE